MERTPDCASLHPGYASRVIATAAAHLFRRDMHATHRLFHTAAIAHVARLSHAAVIGREEACN